MNGKEAKKFLLNVVEVNNIANCNKSFYSCYERTLNNGSVESF